MLISPWWRRPPRAALAAACLTLACAPRPAPLSPPVATVEVPEPNPGTDAESDSDELPYRPPRPASDPTRAVVDASRWTAFDRRFIGVWQIEEDAVRYHLAMEHGYLIITGEDSTDGEPFEVSNVVWSPPALEITFRMPSTDHSTRSVLTVIDDDHIDDVYTGDASGHAIWTRE